MKLTVNEIVKATGAKVLQEGSVKDIASVSIDTRTIKNGDLFVCIKGPHFDGHNFIEQAVEKGAFGILQTENLKVKSEKCVNLQVSDTERSLGDIAHAWRSKMKATVVAITGSNGKSTTKEMMAAGLGAKYNVIKTEGNFNNLIGLPLQVMRLTEDVTAAVFEMGMNAPGEIKRLTEIANPDIGLITNVNPAHLEKLDTLENVAKAKGELFDAMRKNGAIIVNAEDPWCVKLAEKFKGKKFTFGMQNDCFVRFGRLISEGLDQTQLLFYVDEVEYEMNLPVPGVHNVMNAMAAIATCVAMNVKVSDLIPRIEKFSPMKMRFERIQLLNGVQLVCDCYNANPASMHAAIRTVSAAKKAGRFIAVFGDMLELGKASREKHHELGETAGQFNVSKLFLTGQFAEEVACGAAKKGIRDIEVIKDIEELKKKVLKEIKTGDVVLVKGSRSMKMERVVEYLKNEIGV